jgi:polar amino acid transport system substrate-binding protein
MARAGGLVTAGLVGALVLSACGNDSSGGGSAASGSGAASSSSAEGSIPSVSADQSLASMVPAAISSDGTITVGTDSTYAPSEFLAEDGKTIEGFDVDLFTAVAQKLGLKAQFQSADFATLIAGVGSGKYEAGVSSFTINPDRLQQANMVSYFSAGTQWATKKGNPSKVDADNACGLKVAVQTGTVQVDDLTARSQKCTSGGKKAITVDQYDGQDQATAAVVSGKDVAVLADSPVMAYAVKQTKGQLTLLGDIYDSAPYGYVTAKDQTQFAQALQGAVKSLIADGTYGKVLDKWGVQAGAITDPTVNPSVG